MTKLVVAFEDSRIGTVFLILGSLSRLLGRRFLCPNWYMNERTLGVASRTVYMARELSQARGLTFDVNHMRRSNRWIEDVFPNAVSSQAVDTSLTRTSTTQRLLEWLLRGRIGDRVERWSRRVALARLTVHYREFGESVPHEIAARFDAGIALGFHGFRYEDRTVAAHAARRAQLFETVFIRRSAHPSDNWTI